MIAADFALTIEQRDGEKAIVLAGELDLYRAPEIEQALVKATERATDAERRVVLVDLQAVAFLDSTTLALLVDADRRQRGHGRELFILVGPQTPMSVFEVTGFDRVLSIKAETPAVSAALSPTRPGGS